MKKPTRWIYILAFLPGLGQFCLGLTNRGLQLMTVFFTWMYIAAAGFDSLLAFTPVFVFYSYYDALKKRKEIIEFGETTDDVFIEFKNYPELKKYIGWIFLAFGFAGALELALQFISDQNYYYYFGQKLALSIIFIVIGLNISKEESLLQLNATQKKYIGWTLLISGFIILLQFILRNLPDEIAQYIPYNTVQSILAFLLLTGVGFKLIRNNNKIEEKDIE